MYAGFYPEHSHVDLLLGTLAVESDFCQHDTQLGGGPALGFYQMESATINDIKANYLRYRPILSEQVAEYTNLDNNQFVASFEAQTVFTYLHYMRYKAFSRIVEGDILSYADIWKETYNTRLGKGTVEKFTEKYNLYIKD